MFYQQCPGESKNILKYLAYLLNKNPWKKLETNTSEIIVIL